MWISCFVLSLSSMFLFGMIAYLLNLFMQKRGRRISSFKTLFAGVFFAAFFMFAPIHLAGSDTGIVGSFILSLYNSMQVFALGTEFSIVQSSLPFCTEWLRPFYQIWAAILFVLAPVFTFGFVLSLFKNVSAYIKYFCMYFRKVYIFSELNEKSLSLASDIKKKDCKVGIAFNDVFEENKENSFELIERAKQLGAICFKKDILAVPYRHHSSKNVTFFAIGANETENMNQTLRLIDLYKNRRNTHVYVFSTKIESELLLASLEKGEVKVRRINEVQSLINKNLSDRGESLFQGAIPAKDGIKDISAIVIGLGNYGTEMVKALAWYGQMDGYRIEISAFDKDPMAKEKFLALAPDLMSEKYNGAVIAGEAYYKICIHSSCDIECSNFAKEISQCKGATYVFVSLGDDDLNIRTAVYLRMVFERLGIHPIIQAVLYNSQQKKALMKIRNYRKQEYDIEFIGDVESLFTENVIINSELEAEALRRHLNWGNEEEFWGYEYNYRSSVAAAIHRRARIRCGILGADKAYNELSPEERNTIEVLEHKRWNAYMRGEGYVYSGSTKKSSRNDLAKMHNDLVDYSSLSEGEKRKDSRVGSR